MIWETLERRMMICCLLDRNGVQKAGRWLGFIERDTHKSAHGQVFGRMLEGNWNLSSTKKYLELSVNQGVL